MYRQMLIFLPSGGVITEWFVYYFTCMHAYYTWMYLSLIPRLSNSSTYVHATII